MSGRKAIFIGVERGVQKRGISKKRRTNVVPTSYQRRTNVFITFLKRRLDVFFEGRIAQTKKKLHLRDAQTIKKLHFSIRSDGTTFAKDALSRFVRLVGPAGPAIHFPHSRRPSLPDENAGSARK